MSTGRRRLSSLYRTAFVTGASTGLGAAFAQMLLDEGVHVVGTARGHRPFLFGGPHVGGSSLSGERAPHPHFTPLLLDLAGGAAAERAFREAAQAAGGASGFDIVINNAGYSVFGDFAATDFAHWQAQIEVMLINTARLAHAALDMWGARDRRGPNEGLAKKHDRTTVLVNVSSLAAEFPLPFQASYNVVKAGLSALSECLMIETAGTGVVVLDLRPGDYLTDFGGSVQKPNTALENEKTQRVWHSFSQMMQSGPPPAHAAAALRRALLRRRSGTVRCGRLFQAVLAPFLARFGSLALKRRVQARYFGL